MSKQLFNSPLAMNIQALRQCLSGRLLFMSLITTLTACAPVPRVYVAPYDSSQLATIIPATIAPTPLGYYTFLRSTPTKSTTQPHSGSKASCNSSTLPPEGELLRQEQLERVLEIQLSQKRFIRADTNHATTFLIQARTECTVELRTTLEYPPSFGWGPIHRPGIWYGPYPFGSPGYYRYYAQPSFPVERQYRFYIHRLTIHFYQAPTSPSTQATPDTRFPGPLIWNGQAQIESLQPDDSISWPHLAQAILEQYPVKSTQP